MSSNEAAVVVDDGQEPPNAVSADRALDTTGDIAEVFGARILEVEITTNENRTVARPIPRIQQILSPISRLNIPLRYAPPPNHVFRELFTRALRMYANRFPSHVRRALEFGLLLQATCFLCLFTFIHINYAQMSLPCLSMGSEGDTLHDYRYSVFRIEVVEELPPENYSLANSYLKEVPLEEISEYFNFDQVVTGEISVAADETEDATNVTKSWMQEAQDLMDYIVQELDSSIYSYSDEDNSNTIVEFAEEYGLLRLNPRARKALNVSVQLAVICLSHECLGSSFNRFVLTELLGADEIVIASIRNILSNTTRQGFVRNVHTGETYRFVQSSSFLSAYGLLSTVATLVLAGIVMALFTIIVTLLLRYSHQQIYTCVVDSIDSFNRGLVNGGFRLMVPIAPLVVVVLAIIGTETIMTEFFQDTTIAFYVIITVWAADQFYSFCCHTPSSHRYWPRFFLAYHFLFYAYRCRFSGNFSSLALAASWLFIQHSMVYFVHHYELPAMLQEDQQMQQPNLH